MRNRTGSAIAILALGIFMPIQGHAEPTVSDVLARLDAVEKRLARLDGVEKENAILRERVKRLESIRPKIVASTAAGPGVYAAVPPPRAAEANVYKAAPIVAPANDWAGFYVGATWGYADQWSKQPVDIATSGSTTGPTAGIGIGGLLVNTVALASVPPSVQTDQAGPIAGLQLGYNYPITQRLLVGVEADISSRIKGVGSQTATIDASPLFPGTPPGPPFPISATTSLNVEQQLDWLGTVRARFGYLPIRDLLIYGTGGVAYGHVDSSASAVQSVCAFSPQVGPTCNTSTGVGSASATKAGWALGAGMEYALARAWSLKVEYLHYDLGSLAYGVSPLTLPAFPPGTGGGTTASVTNIGALARFNGDIARAGLNYKFN